MASEWKEKKKEKIWWQSGTLENRNCASGDLTSYC